MTAVFAGLSEGDVTKLTAKGHNFRRGKVCDVVEAGKHLFLIYSDRLSAFDRHVGLVAGKGCISAAMAELWFNKLNNIPHHYLDRPHARVIKVRATQAIKVEVIVRGYLTGSIERAYRRGERMFCGVKLAEGLQNYHKLPEIIITPTTKEQHDTNISPPEIIDRGLCSADDWQTIEKLALAMFKIGTDTYRQHGYLLVDTKYEFGKDENGKIIVIDEVHSQDSSRLWLADDYQQRLAQQLPPRTVDKDLVRRWLLANGKEQPVPQKVFNQLANEYQKVSLALKTKTVADCPLELDNLVRCCR